MKLIPLTLAVLCAAIGIARADEKQPDPKEIAYMQRAMKAAGEIQYQAGEITLLGGKAKIKLTDEFRYLDPANARKVLVDIWNNPPESGSTDGMIVPRDIKFFDQDSWAAVILWKDDGYVKDSEFETVDFSKMLKEMRDQSIEESKERERRGFGKMELADWATPPHYDRQTHKLYWAKAFNVSGPVQALNYDIRVLGRSGFFEVSILAGVPQLQAIEAKVPTILGMIDFTDGNRYADYKPGTDKVAAYGIAGLITGGVLAKAGFFKVAALFVAKFAKIFIIGGVALFAGIAKFFGRKKVA